MSTGSASPGIGGYTLAHGIDAGAYVIAQTVGWSALAAIGVLLLEDGPGRWVQLMFFAGMVLFVGGAIKLRPESYVERRRREVAREEGDDDPEVRGWIPVSRNRETDNEIGSPLEQLLGAVPPVSGLHLGPDERISLGVKLFFSGAVVWLLAYGVERLIVV